MVNACNKKDHAEPPENDGANLPGVLMPVDPPVQDGHNLDAAPNEDPQNAARIPRIARTICYGAELTTFGVPVLGTAVAVARPPLPEEIPPEKEPQGQMPPPLHCDDQEGSSTSVVRPQLVWRQPDEVLRVEPIAPAVARALERLGACPLVPEILAIPLSPGSKLTNLPLYDGGDPTGHINSFDNHMTVHNFSDPVRCKVFPTTLKGGAQEWYHGMPQGSIRNFAQLPEAFLSRFASSRQPRRGTASLFSLKQGKEETFRAYNQRFNVETLQIQDLQDNLAVAAYENGLWNRQLISSLAMHRVKTLANLIERAGEHIRADEDFLKKEESKDKEPSKKGGMKKAEIQEVARMVVVRRSCFRPSKLTPLNTPWG